MCGSEENPLMDGQTAAAQPMGGDAADAAMTRDEYSAELPAIATIMQRAHRDKLQLCDRLEAIADTLPDGIDRMECLRIANALVPLLREIHRYEETMVFPAYDKLPGRREESSTERLRAEHIEDECFADEVTEVLLTIGHGAAVRNAEAVGFMLRGLFETMRRHIAFESEHVLPAIGAAYPRSQVRRLTWPRDG
jgi:hemerythrin-like domain-containing protein